jgi:LysR family glycine cleavage system transcriptional activator
VSQWTKSAVDEERSGRRAAVDGVAVDGVAVDGVAVDGVAVDGVAVDGVAIDRVQSVRLEVKVSSRGVGRPTQ